MVKRLVYLLLLGFAFLLFAYFGRSTYLPILHQLRGGQTVAATVEQLNLSARERLQSDLERLNFTDLPDTILIAAFKEERILEVYASTAMGFQRLKTYPFTAYSGQLGPKLQEGDRQIPEGIYEIEYLNISAELIKL